MQEAERRLAAIMFTDMVDYTALSERDEPLALALLEEHRKLLRPVFAKHGGREVKTLGDGFLVEFPSTLKAVRSALEVQQAMSDRNLKVPIDRRILLRVAINVGDVEHRDGDIFGDTVNIASRVHEIADPGSICITQQVYDQIRNSREFQTTSLGQSRLKNVQTPVEVFKIQSARIDAALIDNQLLEPRRIAALPLTSLSSDPQDEYFADGLTEEIINTLSSISDLRVIARTSVMKYKQAKRTVGEIGRELKVGTILEGSVRKAGDRVRITVQLIDVGSEAPIWAQKYDRDMRNVFDIQMDIAHRVADALKVQLLRENRTRIENKAPEDIAAYNLYLRGRYYWNKRSRVDLEKAIEQFGEAIKTDPGYALAYAGLADCYTVGGRHRYLPGDDAFAKARSYAEKALQINDNLAEAHSSLAAVLFNYDWDWEGSEAQFRRAIALNPNYATAHYWLSLLLQTTGNLAEAISEAEKAQALDPLSSAVGGCVIQAYFFTGQYDKAIDTCKRYLDMDPNFVVARDYLVHLYVHTKAFDEAVNETMRLIDQSERKAEAKAHLAYVYAMSGRTQEAKDIFENIVTDPDLGYSNSTIFITIYSTFGDQDAAFRWAEKARETGKLSIPSIRFSPDLRGFRDDPRFVVILQKARLH
jgi:adenylate cyclase